MTYSISSLVFLANSTISSCEGSGMPGMMMALISLSLCWMLEAIAVRKFMAKFDCLWEEMAGRSTEYCLGRNPKLIETYCK